MAIKTESLTINGRAFTLTYSDANRYVVRDGVAYTEAYDPSEFGRVYTEGDEIPIDENALIPDKAEAYDILMGASE